MLIQSVVGVSPIILIFWREGKMVSRGDAKARRVGDRVPQLPKAFFGNEGVLECSGWTELGMGRERVEGENPKRCQATAVQETRLRSEFLENDHLGVLA
jgi:hypothetical protein